MDGCLVAWVERRVLLPPPGAVATALEAVTEPIMATGGTSFAEWARFWIDTYSGLWPPALVGGTLSPLLPGNPRSAADRWH